MSRKSRKQLAALLVALFLALPVLALAQSAVAVPTPANPGFVDKLLADAYPYIMAALGTLVTTILAWASMQLNGFMNRDKAKGAREKLKDDRVEAKQAVAVGVIIANDEKWKEKAKLPVGTPLPPAVAQRLENKALGIAEQIMLDNPDPTATLDVLSDIEKKAEIIQAVEAAKPAVAVAAAPAIDAPAPRPLPQAIPYDRL